MMQTFLSWLLRKRFNFIQIFCCFLLLTASVVLYDKWITHAARIDFYQHQTMGSAFTNSAQSAYRNLVGQRQSTMPIEEQNRINTLYNDLGIWKNMWWMGIRIQKNPCDLWMMQQIIAETRPDFIIEAGTFRGGSALYFAGALDGVGLAESKVITIDIYDQCSVARQRPLWQKHVEFVVGSSTDLKVVSTIRQRVQGRKVMVVLDSVHTRDHVLSELRNYGPMVSSGCYLIVEDTAHDGLYQSNENGPLTAVQMFLDSEAGTTFEQDLTREALILTFNPGGWLRKR